LEHDARGRVVAGEVVVCVPYAVREAARRGVEARKEVLLYALHGMLHLCGFDDRTQRDFVRMHQREDDILKRLGVGAVFAREGGARDRAISGGKNASRRQTRMSAPPTDKNVRPTWGTTGKRVRLPMPPKRDLRGGGR